MSCCGGNCGCGSNCGCGNGCGGCKMFPDFDEKVQNATVLVSGVAPKISCVEGSEMGVAAEDGGCPCGDNCKCDPCTCK